MPPGTHNVRPVFTFHFTCAVEDVKKALVFLHEMLTATSFANRRDVEPYIFKAAQTYREASAPHKLKSAFVQQRKPDRQRQSVESGHDEPPVMQKEGFVVLFAGMQLRAVAPVAQERMAERRAVGAYLMPRSF